MRAVKKLTFVLIVLPLAVFLLSLLIYNRFNIRPGITTGLIEQIESPDWKLRMYAVEALGRIGGNRATESLVAALKDDDSDVRQKAAEALDKLGWKAKNEDEERLYFIAQKDWEKCIALNGTTMKTLIPALMDKNPRVRKKAAEVLGEIENPAIKALVAALRDDSSEVREKAAEALTEMGGIPVIQQLVLALKHEHFCVREKAAESLGKIGDNRVVKPLVTALNDANWKVREKAAEALGRIGDNRAIESLVAALKDDDSDVRKKAAEALDKLGWKAKNEDEERLYFIAKKDWDRCVMIGEPIAKLLIGVLNDKNPYVQRSAAESLARIGGRDSMKLLIVELRNHRSDIRKKTVETLGEIGGSQAVMPLITVLGDNDPEVRKAAQEALVKIESIHTIGPLMAALKHENSDVRAAAAEVLGKMSSPALEPLIAALWDENWEVREEAAKALGKLKDRCAVNPLIAVLKYEDSCVRPKTWKDLSTTIGLVAEPLTTPFITQDIRVRLHIAVITALGQIGDKRVVPVLVDALQCWDTAAAAASALEILGWSAESPEDKVHFLVAKKDGSALRQIWGQTRQVLLKDIKSDEDEIVKNALYAFIAIGREDIIEELIAILNTKTDVTLAETYCNCGNKKLTDAAQLWAQKHGCYVKTDSGTYAIRWGSW